MKKITRKEAKAAGLERYFTGKPCKHGHVAERPVRNRECVTCLRERNRRYYEENLEKVREKRRRWRAENPEYGPQYRRKNAAIVRAVKELGLLQEITP